MAELQLGNIKPAGADNVVVEGKYVKGGYFVIDTYENLSKLKTSDDKTIINGSLCYCTSKAAFFQYSGSSWQEVKLKDGLIDITYADLVSLRNNSKLIPGITYAIIDYNCTTSQENTVTAWNQFDVLVVADSSNKLSEIARARLHSGDTYFADCNLDAWELRYCLDNDTNRFLWANSTAGRGVIYYMKDEWENEAGYDFKNIKYKGSTIYTNNYSLSQLGLTNYSTAEYYYTFTNEKGDDLSVGQGTLGSEVVANKIATGWTTTDYLNLSKSLPFILCLGDSNGSVIASNIFEGGCSKITLVSNSMVIDESFGEEEILPAALNIFGPACENITLLAGSMLNKFEETCCNILVGIYAIGNTFGAWIDTLVMMGFNCFNLIGGRALEVSLGYGSSYNTLGEIALYCNLGNNCEYNIIEYNCSQITLGDNCEHNVFESFCSRNSLGNDCAYNLFKLLCGSNTLADDCSYNLLDENCSNNIFGESCMGNVLREGNYSNEFKNKCQLNTLGAQSSYNFFDQNSSLNVFGFNCGQNRLEQGLNLYNTFGDFCLSNKLVAANSYNTFESSCIGNTIPANFSNCIFKSGVKNTKLENNAGYDYNRPVSIEISSGIKGNSTSNQKVISITETREIPLIYRAAETTEIILD